MENPFKESATDADHIMDRNGPIYEATLEEMGNLPGLFCSLNSTEVRYSPF